MCPFTVRTVNSKKGQFLAAEDLIVIIFRRDQSVEIHTNLTPATAKLIDQLPEILTGIAKQIETQRKRKKKH